MIGIGNSVRVNGKAAVSRVHEVAERCSGNGGQARAAPGVAADQAAFNSIAESIRAMAPFIGQRTSAAVRAAMTFHDVLDEIILALYLKRGKLAGIRGPARVRWLLAFVRGELSNLDRRWRVRVRGTESLGADDAADEAEAAASHCAEAVAAGVYEELVEVLLSVLRRLPPLEVILWVDVSFHGSEVGEVARSLGMRPEEASWTLYRARRRIRAKLRAWSTERLCS